MVELLTRTRTTAIGVDFGMCSLRAVQLRSEGRGWRIHHWINVELEPASSEPAAMEYREQLDMIFGSGTFSGRSTALLLSPPEVEYLLIEAPAAILNRPAAELRTALQFELERQMPWAASEAEVAAWTIKPDATGTVSTMVVAGRTSSIEERLDLLDQRGLECIRADLVPNAMARIVPAAPTDEAESATASLCGVLDIGFRCARFYLLHAGRPVYARVLHGGGRELTEDLAEALHLEFRIAEQYKRIYGVEKTDRGFRSLAGGLSQISEQQLPGVLYAVLRPRLEQMVRDIERSCQYALDQLPGTSVGPMYLVGGGARMPGLPDALADLLGLPVVLPSAELLQDDLCVDGPAGRHAACAPALFAVLAPCIGLALAAGGGS